MLDKLKGLVKNREYIKILKDEDDFIFQGLLTPGQKEIAIKHVHDENIRRAIDSVMTTGDTKTYNFAVKDIIKRSKELEREVEGGKGGGKKKSKKHSKKRTMKRSKRKLTRNHRYKYNKKRSRKNGKSKRKY